MEKKINMEKVKQMTLVISGVILLGVGFMNYNPNNEEIKEVAVTDVGTNRVGDVQLVSSNAIVDNNENSTNSAVVSSTNTAIVENSVPVNTNSEDYFTKTKLDRDEMYSKMLEAYQKIVDNRELPETQKAISIQEIDKINKAQNSIMIAENLIINKGFENVVVLVNNNNVVNVVVKSSFLSNEDIGKIQNVIEREFDVPLEKVNISTKN